MSGLLYKAQELCTFALIRGGVRGKGQTILKHTQVLGKIFFYWKGDVNQLKLPINYSLTFKQMFLVLLFKIIVFIFSI